MNGSRPGRIVCITNCVMYGIFVIGIIGGSTYRRLDTSWREVPTGTAIAYDILGLAAITVTVVSAVGLIKLKVWARIVAVVWNLCIAMLLSGLKIVAYITIALMSGSLPGDASYFDSETILSFALALSFVLLSVGLSTKKVRQAFFPE